ncbi:MAG TPA: hypothetical protein VEA69_15895 [Tepidisphaeraceae bacterium]|nr:hypothetical protein [Tepidisphaeraceae bacterium]
MDTSIPANLSPALRPLADLELALGNTVARTEIDTWSACPLAVVFTHPIHFGDVRARTLLAPSIERWENRDPHYSLEAGYRDPPSRHTLAGPLTSDL